MPKSLESRFWTKVQKSESCWEWTACHKYNTRYGFFRTGTKTVQAHRLSWEMHYGDIPRGMCVCHKCDNPGCVRPDHLFLGTHKDNKDDSVAKNRHAYGEKSGRAKLTEAQAGDVITRLACGDNAKMVAKEFNVSEATISMIKNGVRWKHLERNTNGA